MYHTNQQFTMQEFLEELPLHFALFACAAVGWYSSKWAKNYFSVYRKTVPAFPFKTVPNLPSKKRAVDGEEDGSSGDEAPIASQAQRKVPQQAAVAAGAAAVAAAAAEYYRKDADGTETTFKEFLYELAYHLALLMGGALGWLASKLAIHRFLIPCKPVSPCKSKPCMSDWEDSSSDESMDANATEADWAAGCGKAKAVAEEDDATPVAKVETEPEAPHATPLDQPTADPIDSDAKPSVEVDTEDKPKVQQAVPELPEQQPEVPETPAAAAAAVAFNGGSDMKELCSGDPDDTTASDLSSEQAEEASEGGESKRNKEEKTINAEKQHEESKMVLAPELAALLDTDSEEDSEEDSDDEPPFSGAATWSTPVVGSHRAPPGLSLPTAEESVVKEMDPNARVFQPSQGYQQLYTDGNQVFMMTATPVGKVLPAVKEIAAEPMKAFASPTTTATMSPHFTSDESGPWAGDEEDEDWPWPEEEADKAGPWAGDEEDEEDWPWPEEEASKAGPWAGEEALDDEEDEALWGVCWDFTAA